MLTTAAGTITPARVFIIGAALPDCKPSLRRAGWARWFPPTTCARPSKEQVQSLGARFVELPHRSRKTRRTPAATRRAQDEDFYRRQRELLGKVVAESDVVITTAVIPGKKAPILVTKEMVRAWRPVR